jgi:hypothetical protein
LWTGACWTSDAKPIAKTSVCQGYITSSMVIIVRSQTLLTVSPNAVLPSSNFHLESIPASSALHYPLHHHLRLFRYQQKSSLFLQGTYFTSLYHLLVDRPSAAVLGNLSNLTFHFSASSTWERKNVAILTLRKFSADRGVTIASETLTTRKCS